MFKLIPKEVTLMENSAKIIDLNQRRKFKRYRKWFELYAKFLSIFKRSPKSKKAKNSLQTKMSK
ncbi:hypothetical protein CLCY_4c00470 [Clostridium cylindrosporum DSM 605]|uniref:Uncharacterized protein n=2 Tax=Clostridium cylindrosporum TaxID=1495 RepID=A0A0J8DCU4_CLOCY|nr:hypothetical protein CLCY_4c00470 [Clostridium cylindrosporum DSM 605]